MGVPLLQRPRQFVPWAIAGLVVIIVALLSVWLQAPAGTDLLVRSGLVPPPRPFLELYFWHPLAHPRFVAPGQSVPVTFGLSSHEGDFTDLTWRIETIRASERQLVGSGVETVPDGESRTVVREVPIPCNPATSAQSRIQVRVSVAKPKQEILFWVICRPGGS